MDDEHTLNLERADPSKFFIMNNSREDTKLVFTDPMQEQIEAAMAEDGTKIAAHERFGVRARIDFAENGTMYVLFPASGVIRRYSPDV